MKQKKAIKGIEGRIIASIIHRGRGAVFFGTEFLNMGRPTAVRQALSRLARVGTIKRIGTSLYYYPSFNEKLGGELPPSADAVAQAIARRTDSKVVASGALAANLLGLSTQVPAQRVYLTDGPSRNINIGAYSLKFIHVAPRRMAAKGKISSLLFEALRYTKPENVNDDVIARLQKALPPEAKKQLRKDLRHGAIWMRPLLARIIGTGK
ncbi:MAG: hypothetical protein A2X28_06380 [Elusimicrobia bacterium GWA2_56_46]|nr:MAG: hypothetical protein A2X28_06380 [Elusimicrobia bacterium GWA2_56_46]OGR54919.1 MAG: hypothetical protein A2X39_11610 [Elusimicrobia bacterium GWC2_56_31]HBW23284.1 hypothetical protein [Elusimicrobiota bacterium]